MSRFGLRVQPRAVAKDEAGIRAASKGIAGIWCNSTGFPPLSEPVVGGQRRALRSTRALAIEPRILLLDEPFGALGRQVRKELRQWLRRCIRNHVTSIFVTTSGGGVEVANRGGGDGQGRIEQIGTPGEVYDNPATAFVHGFIG